MLAFFVFHKIRFVRLCARLTMNSELLTALCDRINHLKNWLVQLKNMSECIWKLLGDVLGGLKSVPKPFWSVLGRVWVSWGCPGASCGRPGGVLGRLGSKKVANMAPTWLPKRSQNRLKIEPKNHKNLNASWNRFLEGF